MRLDRIEVRGFRSYIEADLELAPGLTVLVGANGSGKTNLLEAMGFLASLSSFRGAPTEALARVVDQVTDTAVIRGFGEAGTRQIGRASCRERVCSTV